MQVMFWKIKASKTKIPKMAKDQLWFFFMFFIYLLILFLETGFLMPGLKHSK